jgi:hypothetical protein
MVLNIPYGDDGAEASAGPAAIPATTLDRTAIRGRRGGSMVARDMAPILVALILVATIPAGMAVGKSPSRDSPAHLCVSIVGTAPASGWDKASLEDALASGAASIMDVDDPAGCTEPGPVGSPESWTVSTLPVEVIDAGFRVEDGQAHFAVILRNPNPNTWAAHAMAVRLDFFDEQDRFIATVSEPVSLLPGQSGAVVGSASDVGGAARIEVTPGGAQTDWWELGGVIPGELTISRVSTTNHDDGPVTTGLITSTFAEEVPNVRVTAVYRDAAARIVGGDSTVVDQVPGHGEATFRIDASGGPERVDIARTEVFWGE